MTDSSNKPVVFLAFANDQDDRVGYLRNLPEEARQIRDPLQRARSDGLCEVVELANASADDIFRVFQDPAYRDRIAVFHYGGHANGYQLLLESSAQKTTGADAAGLAEFLGQQKGLQLVFLNGCSTQPQVQGLLEASVPMVIATSRAIDDEVAMNFATRFYQGLAGGAGLNTAFREAEAAVKTTRAGQTRSAWFSGPNPETAPEPDRWPWEMFLQPGAEQVADWSLPEAVGDPLFGLPQVPKRDLPDSPYRHLQWFDETHAEIFFGRGHQIREMYDLVKNDEAPPIALLYGQSGAGKSSILAAGLIPRLQDSCEIRYVRRESNTSLLKTLKQTLVQASDDPGEQSVHFAADWHDVERRIGKPLVLVVDQLEECYTRPNSAEPAEVDDFFNELQNIFGNPATRPRGRLILGFRKEWLAEIERRLADRKLPRSKMFLERLGRRGIMEAIGGPTSTPRLKSQYGLTIEEHLPEMIADDLLADRESAIAPTLQILLSKMWDEANRRNRAKPHFDRELYLSLKRKGILLRDFLDQQLLELQQWQSDVVDSGLALDLLAHHTTALGTADVLSAEALPDSYAHRQDILQDLIQRCKDLYLLVDPADDTCEAGSGTRLSHDTLAPLIRSRFDDSEKPGQRARRILNNRVVEWQSDEHGAPLDPRDLQTVEQGLAGSRRLSELEQQLVEASRQERRRRVRAQMLLRITGVVALIAIVTLGALAINSHLALQREKAESFANARQLVDDFYTTIAENELVQQPGLTRLRTELLSKGVPFYNEFIERFGDKPEAQMAVAIAHYNLGRVRLDEGDHDAAMNELETSRQLLEALRDANPDDASVWLPLSKSLMEIGNVRLARQEPSAALADFEAAQALREQWLTSLDSADPRQPEAVRRLADSFTGQANARIDLGEQDAARRNFELAQEMRGRIESTALVAGAIDPDAIRTVRDLGLGAHSLKGLYEIKAEQAWVSMEAAADESDIRRHEAAAITAEQEVLKYAEQAIGHFQIVLEVQPNDALVRSRLADSWFSLAYLGDETKSGQRMAAALDELKTLAFFYSSIVEYRRLLAAGYIESAQLQSDPAHAREAIRILKVILAENDDDTESQRMLKSARELAEKLSGIPPDSRVP